MMLAINQRKDKLFPHHFESGEDKILTAIGSIDNLKGIKEAKETVIFLP